MTYQRRDVLNAFDDLLNQLSLVDEPLTRWELIQYAMKISKETLRPASDKAIYELSERYTNEEIHGLTGRNIEMARRDAARHRLANGMPSKGRWERIDKFVTLK